MEEDIASKSSNRVMGLSLAAAIFALVGKYVAYRLTHSSALFGDAAEAFVHTAATAFAAFSLWYAARPADFSHPYGHGRITYFSVAVEGVLIMTASLLTLVAGVQSLIHPRTLPNLRLGLGIAAVVAVVNLSVSVSLIRTGKRRQSLVLVANGRHLLSDVATTVTAILGLALVLVFGAVWLDSLAAIGIGTLILISGASLIRSAIAGLMDEVDPTLLPPLFKRLHEAVDTGTISGFHQVRCRSLENDVWIDLHIQVPGELSVTTAHHRATNLEELIGAEFPTKQVHITTHVEPEDHIASHPEGHETPHEPFRSYGSIERL